jgi:hypothetical protein
MLFAASNQHQVRCEQHDEHSYLYKQLGLRFIPESRKVFKATIEAAAPGGT